MKKISILALHLGYGGIENCICSLANLLCNDYKVEIISIYKLYDKPVYQLNSKIKIKYLTTNLKPNRDEFKNALKHFNLLKSLALGLQAIKILYLKRQTMIKALKNDDSDITISTRIYLNKLLGKYGHGIKIGWEHNHHHGDSKYIKDFYQSCKHLDKVVLVSETLKNDYQKIFTQQHIQCECLYIPNFIVNWPKKANKLDNNNLISVGRLSKEKGFIDLISVYKLINLNYNDTFLNIVGDGSQKEQIEKNIIKDNMALKIKMHGYQNKNYIDDLYAHSSLYLMCSKTESFGLVLIEAMSYGIPCLAFDSAEGAQDLIVNNYNGFLIKNRNEHEMADMTIKLLKDRKLLKKLGVNARKIAKQYLDVNVYKRWLKMLGEL